jgi:predicted RNA-binding protein with PIN domain
LTITEKYLKENSMHLIIDGYNLLHMGQSRASMTASELEGRRERLIEQLSSYRHTRPCDITAVFDGWQRGWASEKKERRRGIDVIFSRLGEKADEVVKRLAREKGAGAVVVTSDREIASFAERLAVAVIPSEVFREKLERSVAQGLKVSARNGEEETRPEGKKKGPSRRLSKKERRRQAALKKL